MPGKEPPPTKGEAKGYRHFFEMCFKPCQKKTRYVKIYRTWLSEKSNSYAKHPVGTAKQPQKCIFGKFGFSYAFLFFVRFIPIAQHNLHIFVHPIPPLIGTDIYIYREREREAPKRKKRKMHK